MKIEVFPVGMLSTNCYVLENEIGEIAVVDPGFVSDELTKALEGKEDKIKYILFTHSHVDHTMGLPFILEKSNPTVVVHKIEKERLLNPEGRLFETLRIYYKMEKDCIKSAFIKANPKIIEAEQGSVIPFGEVDFKVMHTPGHTDGSVCFVADDFILSGDTLFNGSIGRTDFPVSSPADMEKSLERLCALDKDYRIYPGHGEDTTLNYEKQNNPFLR